jgi:integrase
VVKPRSTIGTSLETLRTYLPGCGGGSKRPLLFQSSKGTPLSDVNIRNRVLRPLLRKLGIPRAGLHAFRHGRVTVLRKNGTPGDLQKLWIGHSSLRTTDRYSHTDEELEYRRQAALRVGIGSLVGPNRPNLTGQSRDSGETLTNAV